MTSFEQIWDDQLAFNRQLRPLPSTPEERAAQVKDFVLYTTSELFELLRVFKWKEHRAGEVRDNARQMDDELADILKCTLSLYQICGWTPERMIQAYWLKTAVVRQRYQEEWIGEVQRPCAVVDIDNVLCDYVSGICDWLGMTYSAYVAEWKQAGYINARSLGVTEERWQDLKHEFRVSGAKRSLPAFGDAAPFLWALRRRNLQIVLLTSRPVDRYPNIYTDTLAWLQRYKLPFDYIWWATDKAEKVIESALRPHIRLIVDDDLKYIQQYTAFDLESYWLRRHSVPTEEQPSSPLIHTVKNLQQVVDHYDARIREQEADLWLPTKTQSTDPTHSTPEKLPVRPSPEDPTHSV